MEGIQDIINRIVIVVGQHKRFGSKHYEIQFASLVKELAKALDSTHDQAVEHLYKYFKVKGEAA